MSTSSPARGYHHGDLRDALLAAAERLMTERAGWTFTLREVARAAGVSHNAPYNHFADRRALLAAVAARGFGALTGALRGALREVEASDVGAGIRATGCAYVAFAVAHPARYRLMFSGELVACEDAAFRAAGEEAFAVLRDLIARGVAAGRIRADRDGAHALAAWSLVHGLAMLLLDGKVPGKAGGAVEGSMIDAVAATLIEGLAVP
ncbi:HTH-type transcriptional repressor FabR [Methylobacterium crusticola]|uniref:HTH-type transcriptional repressor FabR n=1 Tax=Methylobacterium crusticola TaxID=1697972 RepID=A0ABQ4QX95_9HYPH|nr:TetR/AcrR family transcriptional regulator [Methylobacterium crusticola]GJD50010.1 HTH-type transcriptional repressor FabR [Methylobacterium crusticola]